MMYCRFFLLILMQVLLFCGVAGEVRAEEAPPIAPFKTARVRIEGTVSAQGQELPVQGEGEIDATRGASRLTIAVLGATFETIVVDGRTYSRNPLSGRWEYTEGAQAGGFNPAQLAPYDPATIRAAGRNFTRVGPEQVGGVATTHWRADADLARLLGVGGAAASGAGVDPNGTMDLWIGDADGRLRRLRVESGAGASAAPATSAAPAASGIPAARQSLTLTFDSFDVDVAIIAPPGAAPATPGAAFGGGGVLASPVVRTPTVAAAANVVATRNAVRSGGPAAPSAAPGTGGPSSTVVVRIFGVIGLTAVGLAALLAWQHRRSRAGRGADE